MASLSFASEIDYWVVKSVTPQTAWPEWISKMRYCRSRRFVPGLLIAATVGAALALGVTPAGAQKQTKTKAASKVIETGVGSDALPIPVAEMRDAIMAAARSGNLAELLIPIQWNELPPDFGELSVKQTLEKWRKETPDGSGRHMLAVLFDLLEQPYAVLRQGRDVENAKIYIWPAVAELDLMKLSPAQDVAFYRLVPGSEGLRMKAAGKYDGWAMAIGADGTWHTFGRRQ